VHGLITMRKIITGLIALAVVLAAGVAVPAPARADGSGDCNV
jgi:hypothetical protein